MAKTLMILGTASEVGKSLIVTGLCRSFFRAGIRVAPFKAQNMSNNAYVCLDGGEIGWAQALQARACGLEPCVDMNPVLLKPSTEHTSQVIVHGRVWGTTSARSFDRDRLRKKVRESFVRLSQDYDLIILEGAGGAAEINLKDRDIVNFAMAQMADAPVLLVADIDRGGVFAALVGTMELLAPAEREQVKGFIINKFRGEKALLESGLHFLQERTGKPVVGVLPYLPDLGLEAEDWVALERYRKSQPAFSPSTINVAGVALPHIANFTDFLPLAHAGRVALRYAREPDEIADADVVILPGSKNTIADLCWLKGGNWLQMLRQLNTAGKSIVGVCGGYQMLGEEIADPLGLEGERTIESGLGFFPVRTVLAMEKTTRRVEVQWRVGEKIGVFSGYEIHLGRTTKRVEIPPRFLVRPITGEQWQPDGTVSAEGKTWGTYLHGLFASGPFLQAWFGPIGEEKGVAVRIEWQRWQSVRDSRLDRLADALEAHVDMTTIRAWLRRQTPPITREGKSPSAISAARLRSEKAGARLPRSKATVHPMVNSSSATSLSPWVYREWRQALAPVLDEYRASGPSLPE
jgi:adenosylcobyric acid synthase